LDVQEDDVYQRISSLLGHVCNWCRLTERHFLDGAHADLEKDQGVGLEAQHASILVVEIVDERERQPNKDKGAETEGEHVTCTDFTMEWDKAGELDDTVHQTHTAHDETDRIWLHVEAAREEDGDEGKDSDLEEGEEVEIDYSKDDVPSKESAKGRGCRVWLCGGCGWF
jgi:hypothetical protein